MKNEKKKNSFNINVLNFSSASSNAIKSQALASISFKGNFPSLSAEEMIEQLHNEYGVEAHLTNYPQIKMLYDSVIDFTKLNDKNMFKGLIVKEDSLKEDNPWNSNSDYSDKSFVITLNKDFEMEDYEKLANENYENLKYSCNNPKYTFYEVLGDFLCFQYNPYAYTLNFKKDNFSESLKDISTLFSANALKSFQKFNSNYIATKMCGEWCPPNTINFYEDLVTPDINFPKNNTERTGKYTAKFNFKTLYEANKYLEKYGIEARFSDLKLANLTCEAIEDFIQINNGDKMFDGLKIDSCVDDSIDVFGTTHTCYDYNDEKIIDCGIEFNKAYDFKKIEKKAKADYEEGYHPANNPKSNIYHELAHWLHFKSNPKDYSRKCDKIKNNKIYVNDIGKIIFGRVSGYAKTSSIEFVAEYITGRMCGIEYPQKVNNEFEYFTPDLDLKFPSN